MCNIHAWLCLVAASMFMVVTGAHAGTITYAGAVAGINAARNAEVMAQMGGILREAAAGKGDFGLGQASAAESAVLGKAWVGEGFSTASDGATLVSADKLRVYRPPSGKPNSAYAKTGVQANFEQKLKPGGRPISNGHLDIVQ